MTPTIPTGWRKLRNGTVIRKGDKYWHPQCKMWAYTFAYEIGKIKVGSKNIANLIYIRRKKGKG